MLMRSSRLIIRNVSIANLSEENGSRGAAVRGRAHLSEYKEEVELAIVRFTDRIQTYADTGESGEAYDAEAYVSPRRG